MRRNCYIRQIHDEKALMLFSYLQTLPENSRFSYRLQSCIENVILDLKHRRSLNWDVLQDKLENGILMEDPQEHLFSHLVHTPIGSFTVFPGPFMFYQYNLSRLLEVGGLCRIPQSELALVYVLLHLSQILVGRCHVRRYAVGNSAAEDVYIPEREELSENIGKVFFSSDMIENICGMCGCSSKAIDQLVFKAKRRDIRRSLYINGYCDAITMTPFFKYEDGYIVLSPSGLLHSAYQVCKEVLEDKIGKNSLVQVYSKMLFNETACVLRKVSEYCLGEVSVGNINCFLYAEDDTKIFCVVPYVAESQYSLSEFYRIADSYVRDQFKQYDGISMFVVVYSQIDDSGFPLNGPNNVIALSIDDFEVIMGLPDAKLLTLYYYLQDKCTIRSTPYTQEIDLFALYHQKDYNFYFEEQADVLHAEIGMALSLRNTYYVENDKHYVYSPFLERMISVVHAPDIAVDIPIYVPQYLPKEFMFLLLELGEDALYVQYQAEEKINYEIVHSLLLWLYAAHKVKHIDLLHKSMHIFFHIGKNDDIVHQLGDGIYDVQLSFAQRFSATPDNAEEDIFNRFVTLLQTQGLLTEELTSALIHSMFEESNGHFMLADIQSRNPLIEYDGVATCHYVSKRWADKVLAEIADYLNIKGTEKKLSLDDSKGIMVKIMQYLNGEVQSLLKNMNTKMMLDSCLRLHHAMIYWSRLTHYRYKYIASAYYYIGSNFENQVRYANEYAEMNILVQAVIERIIQENYHNEEKNFNIESIDRLFALMHYIVNMGMYFDMLNAGVADSEILILQNGRIVIPSVMQINNDYMSVLHTRSLEHQDVLIKQYQTLPHFEINQKEQDFKDAFVAEFGIELDQFFDVQKRSIEFALDQSSPVVNIPKDQFVREILSNVLNEQQVANFFDKFVLTKDIYANASFKEKLPQRFNRSVQLSSRPWILYNDMIYYSSKSLYMSHQVMVERLDSGIISHSSKLMNSYIGRISEKKGECFTRSLGNYYKGLGDSNISVDLEVKIRPGNILQSPQDLGDIDVLLINTALKKIVCVEAKDYYEARTVYGMLSQDVKITKALLKVVSRDIWCKDNKLLFKHYAKEVDETYEVKTIFLTYHEPTYKYFPHVEKVNIPMMSAFEIIQDPYIVFK